ncbi:neprilysin-1-like [Ornithodoros turicata]|uniref:neprilysin-1-like n=1 Tax=Ornithodoros turicata TaxID=34597 RepID=UPI0031399415
MMTSERRAGLGPPNAGLQNTPPPSPVPDYSDITALTKVNRSRGGRRSHALKWFGLAGGIAFVVVIMAFPAVMIGLSEDARLQYLSLQKQNPWTTNKGTDERSTESTTAASKGLRRRLAQIPSSRRTYRMKFPMRSSTAAPKSEDDIPAGLHAMQCSDESCESETSYMKHLFTSGKDPCNDFYDFVCGHWKEQNPLPPTRLRWSVEDALIQKIEGSVYWFLEDFSRIYKDMMANTTLPTTKLYSHLKACEDTDTIDLKGFAPLRNVFQHLYLEKWPLQSGDDNTDGKDPDLEEITGMIVRDLAIHPFAYISVRGDLRHGGPQPWLQIDEPRLSMSRHKYFDVAFNLNEYKQQVTDALNFVNERNDSALLASEIVDLEQQLAEGMDGTSGWLSEYVEFDTVKLDDLPTSQKWNWPAFLSALFDDDAAITSNVTVLVKSSKYLEKLMKILETTPRHTLMNYLGYRVMSTMAVYLPKKAHFLAKRSWQRLGYQELPERWRVCMRAVDGVMGLTMHALHYESYAKRNTLNFKNHFAKFTGVVSALSNFFNDYAKTKHQSFYDCNAKLQKLKLMSFAPNISKALNLDADIYEPIPIVDDGNALEGYYVARSYVSRAMWDSALNGSRKNSKWRKSVFDLSCSYDPNANSFELPLSLFHEPFFYDDDTLPFDDPRVTFRIARELAKVCPQNGVTYDPDREKAVWMDTTATLNTSNSDDARCFIKQYSNITAKEINATASTLQTFS